VFTVPAGQGGLHRVTLSFGITAGAAAGTFQMLLHSESSAGPTLLEIWDGFTAGETKMFTTTSVLNLPDGTQGFIGIYSGQGVTLEGAASRSFLTLERCAPA